MVEPLKNMYNATFISDLTQAITDEHASFNGEAFTKAVFDEQWDSRELKARMRHITETLWDFMPSDYYVTKLNVLRRAAGRLDPKYTFEAMIFPDFVEVYGLDYWHDSIEALEQFTQQSSGEFAIRPFIMQDSERTMAQMLRWSTHDNFHVRRLASEGCRPRLPWAMALPDFKRDPSPILPILDNLRHDETDYVRRSVANNLNDIAKDNPQTTLDVLTRWQDDSDEVRWITSHALRTLVKDGNPQALSLLGFASQPQVTLENLQLSAQQIAMGDDISFSCEIVSTAKHPQQLMIDYVMHFMRSKGKTTPKVFKLSKITLGAGQRLTIEKSHSFKAINTRRYYTGEHAIQLQINGQTFDKAPFLLTE